MKIVIFGLGNYYENRKYMFSKEIQIVGFIDNNTNKEYVSGIKVFQPCQVKSLEYDYIVLMSLKAYEMKQQLLLMGIRESKIKLYEEFLDIAYKNEKKWHYGVNIRSNQRKRILISYAELCYDGGSITAIRAALALENKYDVDLAVTYGDARMIDNLNTQGISVLVYPALYLCDFTDNTWLEQYEIIIANTTKMLPFAMKICNHKKVLLWLHDPLPAVERVKYNFDILLNEYKENLRIIAVGDIAKKNFVEVFGNKYPINILKYGVPDEFQGSLLNNKRNTIFALIGWASTIKGQDILVDAVSKLSDEERKKFEVWFIGDLNSSSEYCIQLRENIEKYDNIKIIGKLDQEEMNKLYSEIDVVISASREDILPIVLAEGMMHEKLCITSDATGIARYITQGINGMIFKSEDVDDLVEKIRWVLNNKSQIKPMGQNARKLYLQEFSMEKFSNEIKAMVDEMIK